MVKVCTKCKIKKELTEFSKDKKTKDGYNYNCKSCNKEYREDNKDKIKEYQKEYQKEYDQANKDKRKEYYKEYREANKDKRKEYLKEWRKANKEYSNEYKKNRRKTEPLYKLASYLRNRTYQAFKNKGYSKNTKTKEMLGIEWEVAKQHIERQFTKGMNWDNQGKWHIDHIIPLASANTEEELIKLCHYTNLQPLWAEDNLTKSDKIDSQQILLRI
jgi:hypothetical protein